MTDLEISKALALAIGWTMANVLPDRMQPNLQQCWVWTGGNWRLFDYRDWNIIGPIAAKFDCFPSAMSTGNFRKAKQQRHTDVAKWEIFAYDYKNGSEERGKWLRYEADTPQKAIAMAVIGAKK